MDLDQVIDGDLLEVADETTVAGDTTTDETTVADGTEYDDVLLESPPKIPKLDAEGMFHSLI